MTLPAKYIRHYKSGWCGLADMHATCKGQYGMTACTCNCHKEAA